MKLRRRIFSEAWRALRIIGHRRLCRIASLPAIAPDWWPLLPTGPRAPAGGPVKTGCKYQYLSMTAWLAFISRFKTSVYGEGEAADYIYRVAAILFGLDE